MSNLLDQSRRQSMAADMLKSMTEYDYINHSTNSLEKKNIVDMMDIEIHMSARKSSKSHHSEVQSCRSSVKKSPDQVLNHDIE